MMSRAWLLASLTAWHLRRIEAACVSPYLSPVSARDTGASFFRNHDDAARMRSIVAERRAHEDMRTMLFWTRAA